MSLAQVAAVVGVGVGVAAAVWGLFFSRRHDYFASDDVGIVPDNLHRAPTVRHWHFDDSIVDGARLGFDSPVRPAILGLLRRSLIKPRDVAVMVVDLAAREYIKIDEVTSGGRSSWALLRRSGADAGGKLQGYEAQLLDAMFADSNTVLVRDLRRGFGPKFVALQNAIYTGSVKSGLFWANPIEEVIRFRRYAALGMIGSLFLMGLLITDDGGWVFAGVPVLVGAIVLAACSTSVVRRTALGSALHVQGERLLASLREGAVDSGGFAEGLPFALAGGFASEWGGRCDLEDPGGVGECDWLSSRRLSSRPSGEDVAVLVGEFAVSFEKMVRDSRRGNKS